MSGKQLNLEDLQKILLKVVENENLRDYTTNLKNTAEKGDGYMGLISFVEINAKNPEGRDVTLELVVKTAPTSEKFRLDNPIRTAFLLENYMYDVVHPKFHQFQKKYNITKPFDSMAKCYATDSDQLEESIVMENLKVAGYTLWNRKISMNKQHVTFVLKEYGKLHSLSYALKQLDPLAFKELTSGLKHNVINEFLKNSESTLTNLCEKLVKSFDETKDVELVQSLRNYQNNMINFLMVDSVEVDEYSVITHGDCWSNNMMFKYEGTSTNSPSNMRILDWQASNLAAPVLDISYFFYTCSSPEVLDELDAFLKIYHDSLSEHLEKFGLDSKKIYPVSKLKEQWKVLGKYGFCMAFIAIKVMLADSDEAPDVAAVAENGGAAIEAFDFKSSNDDEYLNRLQKLARHLYERKFI